MADLHRMFAVYTTGCYSLLAVTLASPALGANAGICPLVDCKTVCESNSPDYHPQKCDSCCPGGGGAISGSSLTQVSLTEKRITAVEDALVELKVMMGVLLALVLLLLLAFVLLFLYRTKNPLLNFKRVFSSKKKDGAAAKEKNGNLATTVGRLANHQSDCSPQPRRAAEHSLSTLGDTSLEPQPRPFRTRQPSESTCPEEGNDPPRGYDNLGLSTSTIDTNGVHNTSLDTISSHTSANTMHTILPSMIHSTSNGHNTKI